VPIAAEPFAGFATGGKVPAPAVAISEAAVRSRATAYLLKSMEIS
jgi:hypothetical protein